jgi:hypothetical protein
MDSVEENKTRIGKEYLPQYSPELNPFECLDQDVFTILTGKKKMNDAVDLEQQVTDFINHRRKDARQVKRCFHHTEAMCPAAIDI